MTLYIAKCCFYGCEKTNISYAYSWYACVVTSIHTLCIPCMIIEAHDSREGNLKGVVHMNVFNSILYEAS